jgi:hypothetical protein
MEHLESSDLVIADISTHNPNVFFEMGYRARTRKPIIYLRCEDESLPFDISTIRIIDYSLTDLEKVDSVKDRLEKTINSFAFSNEDDILNSNESTLQESVTSSMLPTLYNILDAVGRIENKIESVNKDTLSTVIQTLQNTQPQMSPEAAMQNQLMSLFFQNPDSMLKLAEIADKFPTKK